MTKTSRASPSRQAPRDLIESVLDAFWMPYGSNLAVVRTNTEFEASSSSSRSESRSTNRNPSSGVRVYRPRATGLRCPGCSAPDARTSSSSIAPERRLPSRRDGRGIRVTAWSPGGQEVWFAASRAGATRAARALGRLSPAASGSWLARPSSYSCTTSPRTEASCCPSGTARPGCSACRPGDANETELGWLQYSWVEDLSTDGKTILFGAGPPGPAPPSTSAPPTARPPSGSEKVSPVRSHRTGRGCSRAAANSNRWFLLPTRAGMPRDLPRGPIGHLKTAQWLDGNRLVLSGDVAGHPDRILRPGRRERLPPPSSRKRVPPPAPRLHDTGRERPPRSRAAR